MDGAWKTPPLRRDAVPTLQPGTTRKLLHRLRFHGTRCFSNIFALRISARLGLKLPEPCFAVVAARRAKVQAKSHFSLKAVRLGLSKCRPLTPDEMRWHGNVRRH